MRAQIIRAWGHNNHWQGVACDHGRGHIGWDIGKEQRCCTGTGATACGIIDHLVTLHLRHDNRAHRHRIGL